ncbi:MAG: hypothetical protein OSB83_14760 [Planctomycetota bacterium]|nr:hypothetical protein [Planctomycetota bacterium]
MMLNCRSHSLWVLATLACAVLSLPVGADEARPPLPDPDGRPADMSKPVQVYILMGQSNMLGAGNIGKLSGVVKSKRKYPYLVDEAGNWTVRKDVRNVRVNNIRDITNEWMTIGGGNIGPEIGIGHYVGHVTEAPVLILKSCTGNRSLGWDLLPPDSERYEFGGKTYAGYKDSPESWAKGTTPRPIRWYAGKQYDTDIAAAKRVLSNLGKYYPGATRYEIAGFFFWQGDKDRYNAGHATRYEKNLVHLIKTLRKEFKAPNAYFVCATLGQTKKGAGGNEGLILNAQLAVDGKTGKYPEFRGNVASVYSNPLSMGGSSNGHYSGNPETYMNVGEGLGRAMAELLGSKSSLSQLAEHLDSASRPVYRALEKKNYSTAWKALKKFEETHNANVKANKLDEDALATQKTLLAAFKQEIDWPVDQAISEIEGLKKSGDVYRLSLVFRDHDKAFKGIDKFDMAVGAAGKELRGSRMRSAISTGKKFYAFIDGVKRSESKRKGPRSAAGIKPITAYLNRFAKREKDSIYGRAATIAAKKIADPDHVVNSASSYIQLAQTAE